ncbi:MAG TPA: hypothetical protein VIJ85_12350, partial [Rhizomicrobium sp.]
IKSAPETGTRLSSANAVNGIVPMILGRREMAHLHLFISYKEQKLYITPSSPPADAASAQTATH